MTLFLSGLKIAGLGCKILWGKDLATRYSVFNELFLTAFGGAMMNEFEMRRKVRCHNGAVEDSWERFVVQRSRNPERCVSHLERWGVIP